MKRRVHRPAVAALVAAGAGALAFPAPSAAHLVTTGMGPVYDGIGHLLLTPEDLVPALALALYAGLRGTAAGRRAIFLLPLAWLLGGLAGTAIPGIPALPLAAASFVILGGLVAADLALPIAGVTTLAIALGLVHGALNGALLKDTTGALGLLGVIGMLFVVVTLASALVVSLRRPAARIAVRVAGSWIAAIGVLMFGWALR